MGLGERDDGAVIEWFRAGGGAPERGGKVEA
jgi:hypothetical protein